MYDKNEAYMFRDSLDPLDRIADNRFSRLLESNIGACWLERNNFPFALRQNALAK